MVGVLPEYPVTRVSGARPFHHEGFNRGVEMVGPAVQGVAIAAARADEVDLRVA